MSAGPVALSGVPAIGARVGRHVVDGVLGRGGMGVVLSARHEVLGDRVAIKVLVANAWATAEAEARFVREAQICAQLRSDHAVRVFDVGRLDETTGVAIPSGELGAPYLVMELLQGKNLEEIVAPRGQPPRPLGLQEAIDCLLEACEVLAEAHAANVIHRDIKPSNLFLARRSDGSPTVKVLDFGIAKRVEPAQSLTATTAVIGTPNFMSPEQLRASRDVDARSDVWSLGATLYALLTGKAPFEGASAAETTVNVLTAAPMPLTLRRRDLPPAVDHLVLTCLEKDPGRRFPSVRALADALVAFATPRGRAAHTSLIRRGFGGDALAATAYAGTVRLGDGAPLPPIPVGASAPYAAARTAPPVPFPPPDGAPGTAGWGASAPLPPPDRGPVVGLAIAAAGLLLAVLAAGGIYLARSGSAPAPAAAAAVSAPLPGPTTTSAPSTLGPLAPATASEARPAPARFPTGSATTPPAPGTTASAPATASPPTAPPPAPPAPAPSKATNRAEELFGNN